MSSIKKYLSLVKFSHTIFAMPFAIIGFFLGIKFWADFDKDTVSGYAFWFTRKTTVNDAFFDNYS